MLQKLWLIAEYCRGPFYMGWHLYLRENREMQQRNADGSWGWIRWHRADKHPVQDILDDLGIVMNGDGTCDDDGYAEIARRFPFTGEIIGGKTRGGILVKREAKFLDASIKL